MRLLRFLAVSVLLVGCAAPPPPAPPPVAAREHHAPFITEKQVDLLVLLPPPPALDSPAGRADMAESVRLIQARTKARARQAWDDADESVFRMFGPVMGPGFTAEAIAPALPFFKRLAATEDVTVEPVKTHYNRVRPFLENPKLQPAAPRSTTGSYPSGHSTRVTVMGIVLAAMVPEKRDAIFARIQDYMDSRVIAGLHYRSDTVAGRLAGTAVDAVLFQDPAFMAEYGPARGVIRQAVGLAP